MSGEKQIEEMAKIICKPTANKGNCDRCGFHRKCSKFDDATDLYNAGYRKQRELTPCDVCKFNPPSSGDGKPCFMCPAQAVIKVGAE